MSFARSLGEFGATITFVSNIPGETQTLPLAIYALTQVPGGDPAALRLTVVAVAARDAGAARLGPAGAAHRPPPFRRLSAMLEVDIEHRLGAFALDVQFEAGVA